ncbi:MAG TPA: quinone-dependent dihydroorotate dehydrogenase [Candidatus Thermoplasmatota archaeon]|nr:quinone-dependent dihydroorotate dehydrogenase [Candidatus Thermoplasmatota archaeon]
MPTGDPRSLYRLARPLVFQLDAERAHDRVVGLLSRVRRGGALDALVRAAFHRPDPRLASSAFGVAFPSPVGLAAGFDKSARCVDGLAALGFGHVEVGTVTPRPQPGNPRPRIFRDVPRRGLVNRLGFNNDGAVAVAARLARARPGVPVGVNVGKNRDTPADAAHEDYASCVRTTHRHASYFVVNVSSPNTPGLRALQSTEALARILDAVREANAPGRPTLVKIAPDLPPDDVRAVVELAVEKRLAGIVATNTTIARTHHGWVQREPGGLSGAPLRALSNRTVRLVREAAGDRLSVIGVGGVFTADDALEKLAAGADLVQVYTGMVYEGPGIVKRIHRGLVGEMERLGFERFDALCESLRGHG